MLLGGGDEKSAWVGGWTMTSSLLYSVIVWDIYFVYKVQFQVRFLVVGYVDASLIQPWATSSSRKRGLMMKRSFVGSYDSISGQE